MFKEYKKALNQMKKEVYKKTFSDPTTYFYLVTSILSTLQNGIDINENLALYLSAKTVNVLSLAGLIGNYVKYENSNNTKELSIQLKKSLTDIAKNTETYSLLLQDYNKITDDIAKLFKELNFTDPLDICMHYHDFLYDGILSYNKSFNYKIFPYDKDCVEETMGARVFSGAAVCRHIASLLSDVMEKMGYVVVPLSTTTINKDTTHDTLNMDHLVIGLINDGKRVVYDPTNDVWATYYKSKEIGNLVLFDMLKTGKKNTLVISKNQQIFAGGQNRYINFAQFLGTTDYIDQKTVFDSFASFTFHGRYDINNNLIRDFYDNDLGLMERIANEEKKISPHSDSPILKWTID